jgi:separase
MKSKVELRTTVSSPDILDALVKAEKHLSAHLKMSASTGSIIKTRETIMSLVLVYAFKTSLGDRREDLPSEIAALLGRLPQTFILTAFVTQKTLQMLPPA